MFENSQDLKTFFCIQYCLIASICALGKITYPLAPERTDAFFFFMKTILTWLNILSLLLLNHRITHRTIES